MDKTLIKYSKNKASHRNACDIAHRQDRAATHEQADWVVRNIGMNLDERWYDMTLKIDGEVRNGAKCAQSPWSTDASGTFPLVMRALDWTVTELRRRHKKLQFVPYIGGNQAMDIRTHIHALIRIPDEHDPAVFIERLHSVWKRNLVKTLKSQVSTRVWLDAMPIQNGKNFNGYACRTEGLIGGTDKILLTRSFSLATT
jgi:hypothetical protein